MARNDQRDAEIFRKRCSGWSHAALADEYELSERRISEIITKERGKVSVQTRADRRAELAVQLAELRRAMQEIVDGEPGELVKTYQDQVIHSQPDHGARIYAARVITAIQHREAVLLGLNEPTQVEQNSTVRYEIVGVDPDEV